MDLVQDRASNIAAEDRISHLPEDIIHHILSFIDLKHAIQFCTSAKKWKQTWISMPHLNLNRHMFHTQPQFARFVKHALSHRDNQPDLSSVELTFTGAVTQFVVKSILKYAYSHNVSQLTMTWFSRGSQTFPQYLFSSRSLKHLTLATNDKRFYWYSTSCIPTSPWDFPALETLSLSHMKIGGEEDKSLDLFSKCVNLKDLKLHRVSICHDMDMFNVCAPNLTNLTITEILTFPKAFNVVAPRLENLTARVRCMFNTRCLRFPESLRLSSEGFTSLEKVNLSLPWASSQTMETDAPALVNLFHKLHSAKFLILDMPIIETLSSCVDQLSRETCPLNSLKSLKINTVPLKRKDPIPTVPPEVKKYLLENSPSATFIMDLPQVAQKRSRQQVHNEAMAKKVAKLEEKIKKQDQVIAWNNGKIQRKLDRIIANLKEVQEALHIIRCKIENGQ